jgi:hypothetical protein
MPSHLIIEAQLSLASRGRTSLLSLKRLNTKGITVITSQANSWLRVAFGNQRTEKGALVLEIML